MRKEMNQFRQAKQVKMMATAMDCQVEEIPAIMTIKAGDRMTCTLTVVRNEAMPLININDVKTYCFDTVEELDKFINKKFELFATEKELWQTFTGMDDETWEEWNK